MERSGFFKELVYTRCGPAYSIRGQEMPDNNGYAIFDSSEDLWATMSESELMFAERIIVRQFQWSYGCPVKQSWSYLLLPHGEEGVFADLYAYTEEDGANNSEDSNMRGSHLAQMLIGIPSMYPYELIGSSYFSRRQQASTDDYYLKDCAPRLPDIKQKNIAPGRITRDFLQQFMHGKEAVIQSSVAWLIEQMGKPAKERRPIVILDQSDLIPFWIAAITSCLPLSLARKVPFYTCREGLERLASSAFYRVNTVTDEYTAQINLQDPDQEARPLAMLLGCASEDVEAARKVAVMPLDAPCVLLNGASLRVNFTPDERIMNSQYILQIRQNCLALYSMLPYLDELKNIPFSPDILQLYDALFSLNNKARPVMHTMVRGIRVLRPYIDEGNTSIRRVMNSLIQGDDYQSTYVQSDASEGYPLLSEMIQLCRIMPEYKEKTQGLMLDMLKNSLGSASSGLEILWSAIQSDHNLVDLVCNKLIGEEQLSFISVEAAKVIPERNCSVLLMMQDHYIHTHSGSSWEAVVNSPMPVIASLFQRSVRSAVLRSQLIQLTKNEPRALANYLQGGAMISGQTPQERAAWWQAVSKDGVPVNVQVDAIELSGKFPTAQEIEQVLILALRNQGLTQELTDLYDRHLASVPVCGMNFFQEALHRADSLQALENLWHLAQRDALSTEMTKQLLGVVDAEIRFDVTQDNEKKVRFVTDHAKNIRYPNTSAYLFLRRMTERSPLLGRLKRPQNAILNAWEKADPEFVQFQMDQDLVQTSMGDALLKKASDHSGEPAAHLLVIAGFRFVNVDYYTQWIASYVDRLFSEQFGPKDQSLAALCALKVYISKGKKVCPNEMIKPIEALIRQGAQTYVSKNTDYLIDVYAARLETEKKTGSYAKNWVLDCQDKYGKNVAQELKKITDQAIATYEDNNHDHGGLLRRLFGHK